MLLDILALFCFVILIYAIAGTHIYAGLYNQVCYHADGNPTYNSCYLDTNCKEFDLNCGASGCEIDQYCWNSAKNMNRGVTSFDNIFVSCLTVLNVIFIEGWSTIMFMGRTAFNEIFLNDIYFISMVILGSFFLMNLIKAVLFVKFHEAVSEQKLLQRQQAIMIDE